MNREAKRRFIGRLPNLSALAWELWHQTRNLRTAHVLVPDLEWAEKLREDLRSFDQGLEVLIFPPFETYFLRSRSPSSSVRWERLRTLHRMAHPSKNRSIVLVPSESLIQKSPSIEFYRSHSLTLSVGTPCSRETLSHKLAQLGYLPSELVEHPGQFAIRGGVLDVFPATEEYPLRLDLFDDILSSLRFFHPESQRKLGELQTLTLGPAREFLLPETQRDTQIFQQLKTLIRSQKRPLEDREALFSRFQHQSIFPEIDYWGPLLRDHFSSKNSCAPLDFFEPWTAVIEAHSIEGIAVTAHGQSTRNFENALEDAEWLPPSESFLLPIDQHLENLRRSLAECRLWLSHKQNSGLAYEPEQRTDSSSLGFDILESELAQARNDNSTQALQTLIQKIQLVIESRGTFYFVSRTETQLDRLCFLLEQRGLRLERFHSLSEALSQAPTTHQIRICLADLNYSFWDCERKQAFMITDTVFGTPKKRSSSQNSSAKAARSLLTGDMALLDLNPGDLIVHAEHGIGKYIGLRMMNYAGIPTELIEIEYRDNDKLFVPVTRLSLIQKHSVAQENMSLDKLGGQTWLAKKAKVKKDLRSIAGELLHLYSVREMAVGPSIQPSQEQLDAFASSFPYTETEDQLKAIEDCLRDLKGPRPMDRLVCGDVGYGKTEVALRAAHAVVAAGYQVAVLVPTTLLALQHEDTFKKRMSFLHIRVDGLSRFKTPKEKEQTILGLKDGSVKIVVGTHSLLSNNISFHKLGLLIVDEEQKFGVLHKEKIKKLRNNVHVLAMSATPIPRTLNMSMSGLKELSLISTPPQNRVSVKTYISRKKGELIREAVTREIARGGQIFYVHNRIQTILRELTFLKELLPEVNIEYVHGQMEEKELEKRVLGFYQGHIQLLLTTSIVESGLDIPSANTLIVDRADHFGLSQLYQLRGRVGRSTERAYAYFLIPERGEITADAEERLRVLETYQHLGSGFHIASHDLELRGAGDLLGRSQSGNISALGFDTYAQLLQECIAELKGEHLSHPIDPDIQLPIDTTIPETFIPEIGLRLMVYRRLAACLDENEVDQIGEELVDRFGPLPNSVQNLMILMRIKCQLRRLRIRAAVASKYGVSLSFDESTPVNPQKIVDSIKRYPEHYQLTPDGKLVIKKPANAKISTDIVRSVEGALAQLETWCS